MELNMTAAERTAFLTETARVGVVSIDAPGRAPVSSPVWFTYEADATVTFSVGVTSRKAELLRASGRATLCVQSEEPPYKYVSIEGAATERSASTEDDKRARAHRYLGPEFGELYLEATKDDAEVTFVLQPQRWASLDYNKVFD